MLELAHVGKGANDSDPWVNYGRLSQNRHFGWDVCNPAVRSGDPALNLMPIAGLVKVHPRRGGPPPQRASEIYTNSRLPRDALLIDQAFEHLRGRGKNVDASH